MTANGSSIWVSQPGSILYLSTIPFELYWFRRACGAATVLRPSMSKLFSVLVTVSVGLEDPP